MAKRILTVLLIVLLNVLVGCGGVDSGRAQLMPDRTKTSLGSAPTVKIAKASETDIVEDVAVNRQAYRQGLELLIEFYTKTGNNMKFRWAKKELAALNAIPQYKYVIEAGIAGPNLKVSDSIPEADELYRDAVQLERKAKQLIIVKDDDLLRSALDKYNQLIKKHRSSDKIDDAAYRAGSIYEYFKDYTIAILYYERAYQWDPETPYPARFKRAFVLDKHLHRRDEALKLYQQAIRAAKKDEYKKWKEFAEKRIRKLTKSDERL
jgi:tetratricopeptide (TPR) repeat protein